MNDDAPPTTSSGHLPVLLHEVMDCLAPAAGKVVLDCTMGRGGHCRQILPMLVPDGMYIGLDLDADNLDYCRQTIVDPPVPLHLFHCSFDQAKSALDELGIAAVDGLLADLGFSSNQVDDPQRGMSFSADGPLDMRLDRTAGDTAADLLARLSERDLADLIWTCGEERLSRRIARKIVDARRSQPIKTTRQLADLCVSAYARAGSASRRSQRWRIHPATRTFQALRIAVNRELDRLDGLLGRIERLLGPDGRAAIISFHSLEDRRVKRAFAALAAEGKAELITRKPIGPQDDERQRNPRSRSAKLRALRCLESTQRP